MITHFVTVYPGHIDLPDCGREATPANEQRFTKEQLATPLTTPMAMMVEQLQWVSEAVMPDFRC